MAEQYLAPRHYHINNATDPTFAEAAQSYLQHGGERRYLDPIVEYFGETPLRAIYPFDLQKMAETLYDEHSNATRNRQAITPARAVMMHAYERGWCQLIRVKRFKEGKPKRPRPASAIWLHAFTRQAEKDGLPHLAAIVIFMAQTGARISEAVALEWAQVDLDARTALLLKTKTGTNSTRHLTDELVTRLRDLRADDHAGRVFRYTNRHSVNERIKAVCERADIPNKSPHTCGRHTFATTAIEMGVDIKTAMEAGDWKSSSVFLETYVHARVKASRLVADRFNFQQFSAV